ncbi:hypothetical protein [Vibrio cholerae]|uniref:hypothetical protein n=1 Tax=Vibrio cholerae TaxID=666 RepID=UPI003080BDBF|nr:hypothetical protein [Vibrio cholerae]
MKTVEIIEACATYFRSNFDREYISYEMFSKIWRSIESNSSIVFNERLKSFFPLRDAVVKLVYYEVYERMPFCKEYILKNYEQQYDNIKYLLYPVQGKARKLLVFYSGLSPHPTYNRFSWYWDETEKWLGDDVFLFLNDLDNSWYCGFDGEKSKKYFEIISNVMKSYSISNKDVFMIGGSMGAYGALMHGLTIDVKGIIAINPQISLSAAALHNDSTWEGNIKKIGNNFQDIGKLMLNSNASIYIESGEYPADREAVKVLKNSILDRNGITIMNLHGANKHTTISPNKEQLSLLISLLSNSNFSTSLSESLALNEF